MATWLRTETQRSSLIPTHWRLPAVQIIIWHSDTESTIALAPRLRGLKARLRYQLWMPNLKLAGTDIKWKPGPLVRRLESPPITF